MTPAAPARTVHHGATAREATSVKPALAIEVLVCGSRDHGDDGAPIAAAALLRGQLPNDVRLRLVERLTIDHLLAVPSGAGVVVVDAASGIPAGHIVELPLDGLIHREDRLRPRSSSALEFPEVIGLTELIRRHPLRGRIVAIGGSRFGPGPTLSACVLKAVPALVAATLEAIQRTRV